MKEKIYKLMTSNLFEDRLLSLVLLDNLKRKDFNDFLKSYTINNNIQKKDAWGNTDYYLKLNNITIPKEYDFVYIKGKKLYYLMQDNSIAFDRYINFKKWHTKKTDPIPLGFDWKNEKL